MAHPCTAADLASAPWQDNAAALVASAEHCDGDSMARIRDFASNHGGKVVLIGASDKSVLEHEKVLCLEDLEGLKDALSSLSLSVSSENCDGSEVQSMMDVHVICQSACDMPNLDFETTSSLPEETAFNTKLYFESLDNFYY